MAKKKKKKLNKVSLVKAMSRAAIGKVPGERVVPDKKNRVLAKQTKYKPTLSKLLVEE
jgi:hypothetical protein